MKKGDKIIILDCTWNLNDPIMIGEIYELVEVLKYNPMNPFINRFIIIDDLGKRRALYQSQFMELGQYRTLTINQIIK